MRYPVLPYPKGDNDPDYAPGYILQPTIVPDKRYKPTQPDENAGEDMSGQFSLF